MAPSSRHLYPEWLRPRNLRGGGVAGGRHDRRDEGPWQVWEWLRAFDRRHATLVDVVLAAGLFVLCSGWVIERTGTPPNLWFAAALVFPLILRRRAPMTVFLVIAAVAFVQWLVTGPQLADVALLVALYTVALESPWPLVAAAVVILEAGVVMATVRWDLTRNDVHSLVFLTGLVFTALLAGVVVRALRSQLDWLAERAQRLEVERDQQATLAAVTERARIAREMHDVVSHNIQVMVTLADAASTAQASDPARAAEAVHEVSSTGRQALTDMRRMLGVLRDEPAPAGAVAGGGNGTGNGTGTGSNGTAGNGTGSNGSRRPPLAPQPGLGELDALAERVRGTGLDVSIRREGVPFEVSGAAGLTVYRVVQEALTNALKHAEEPTTVEVRLAFADPDVSVRITDDGRTRVAVPESAAARGGGHGLAGMAERAAAFDGTLRSGPGHDGGWEVEAVLRECKAPTPRVTIRVVLADDQALLRKGFRMILEAEDGVEIVGESPDGADAVRLVELYRPDVVLMDVRMPVLDGIEATRAIVASEAADETRVLILTTFDLDEYAFSALRAGASGFLLKDVPPAELVSAIRTVARGDAVVSPRITRRLLEEYADLLPDLSAGADGAGAGGGGAEHPALASLTEREREVLLAVADGLSNAEIAERLYVSEATVKSHVGRLLAKLGLRDRVQAVVFAFQSGLVRP